jgi:hypothetical protein
MRLLGAALLTGLLSSSVYAQPGPKPSKDYKGVVPGGSAATGVRPGKPVVHWVGFQKKDDSSSRIFVQLGTNVEYRKWLEGPVLYVLLEGARIGNANASRRLDMRFFKVAPTMAKARRVRRRRASGARPAHSGGVLLEIHFASEADAADPSAIMNSSGDGFAYLNLDFAPPSGQADASEEP